ncbi:MAG: S8 family serine peptidase, partial [Acidobacteriota bacterium]
MTSRNTLLALAVAGATLLPQLAEAQLSRRGASAEGSDPSALEARRGKRLGLSPSARAALRSASQQEAARTVDVIVTFEKSAEGNAENLLELAETFGATRRSEFGALGMASWTVPAAQLSALAQHPAIAAVHVDQKTKTASVASRHTASKPHFSSFSTAANQSVGVAVLDSGVQNHEHLGNWDQWEVVAGQVVRSSDVAADEAPELLFDGDLESKDTWANLDNWQWNRWNAWLIETERESDAASGRYALEFEGRGSLSQDVAATPGTFYTLRGQYQMEGSPSWAGAGIDFYDANDRLVGKSYQDLTPTEKYSEIVVSGQAPPTATRVHVFIFSEDDGEVLIDDLSLKATLPSNLLANGDFEDGCVTWWCDSTASFTSGSTGKALVAGSSGVSQVMGLVDGVYTLRGVYRTFGSTGGAVGIDYFDDHWNEIGEAKIDLGASSTTRPFSVSGRPPSGTKYVSAWFWSPSNSLVIDNASVSVSRSRDDSYGHGTHVAGIIAGTGHIYQGIAPDVRLLSLKVLDGQGRGTVSDFLAAANWLLLRGIAEYDVRVVNLSLGAAPDGPAAFDPLVNAVESLWQQGVVVVSAAGNHGREGHYTVASPGISRRVITVGSLTDQGTATKFDDHVSTYSSLGPTAVDNFVKPDLLAPGNRYVSTSSDGSYLTGQLGEAPSACFKTQCSYMELSGTSMATAVVSGAAAVMIAADPSLNPDTIKARLMASARKIEGDPITVGAGVVDIQAALKATGTTHYAASPRLLQAEDGGLL